MKILLADPHTMIREGIAKLLIKVYPFAEICQVPDSAGILEKVHNEKWNIVVTEISMPPGNSGLEAIKEIRTVAPGLRVLVLSICEPEQFAVRAMKAGAFGYLSKSACFSEIFIAINQILSGKKYINTEVAGLLAESVSCGHEESLENLSNREFEVLGLLGKGYTVSHIANQIILSSNTVSTFRSRIFEKMGFKNDLELVRYAVEHRLVE